MGELFTVIKKYQHDIYFVVIGLVMAAALVVFFAGALGFVAMEIERALSEDTSANNATRFDLNGLHQLNVGAPVVPASIPSSSSAQTP